jgi:hypothetical protein
MDVKNNQDKTIGEISDVIFDIRQGEIAYGLTSFGGTLGVNKKTAAVPWKAIRFDSGQKIARLDADESTLTAAEFDTNKMWMLSNPDFARKVHQSFGQEYGVYGYVPPAGKGAGAIYTGAWAADSEYNKSFKPDTVTTIDGKVMSVSTFTPKSGSGHGLMIKVETSSNTTEDVQLGPQGWMDQNMKFNEGDHVSVTGSKVWFGLGRVIMASEVNKGGQTLKLRDDQGKPMWNSASGSSQPYMKDSWAEPNREPNK